jgi:hypothetical protein
METINKLKKCKLPRISEADLYGKIKTVYRFCIKGDVESLAKEYDVLSNEKFIELRTILIHYTYNITEEGVEEEELLFCTKALKRAIDKASIYTYRKNENIAILDKKSR